MVNKSEKIRWNILHVNGKVYTPLGKETYSFNVVPGVLYNVNLMIIMDNIYYNCNEIKMNRNGKLFLRRKAFNTLNVVCACNTKM